MCFWKLGVEVIHQTKVLLLARKGSSTLLLLGCLVRHEMGRKGLVPCPTTLVLTER